MKKMTKYINEKIVLNTKKNFRWILTGIIVGLVFGWLIFSEGDRNSPGIANSEDNELVMGTNADGETVWTCSMHPQIKQNKPGQCPI